MHFPYVVREVFALRAAAAPPVTGARAARRPRRVRARLPQDQPPPVPCRNLRARSQRLVAGTGVGDYGFAEVVRDVDDAVDAPHEADGEGDEVAGESAASAAGVGQRLSHASYGPRTLGTGVCWSITSLTSTAQPSTPGRRHGRSRAFAEYQFSAGRCSACEAIDGIVP